MDGLAPGCLPSAPLPTADPIGDAFVKVVAGTGDAHTLLSGKGFEGGELKLTSEED